MTVNTIMVALMSWSLYMLVIVTLHCNLVEYILS